MTDIELYNQAKEAYYNGDPIMEDFEFDELEKRLGLENKSYIGTKHNPKYTIEHPFIMGSLSKVQIHKDKNGEINWNQYFNEVCKYIKRNDAIDFIITPKFDGCSFEVNCIGTKLINCSSRGDGSFGADYTKHLCKLVQPNVDMLGNQIKGKYCLRGEVLIDKKIFINKYSEFVNPRSFVSGILNHDYSEDSEFQSMLDDLSIVIYDIRVYENGWRDYDWIKYNYIDKPKYYIYSYNNFNSVKEIESIYNTFSAYRDTCNFALDGIVIKPADIYRENNLTEHRPKDCVAIKFIPMLQETEIIDIEWNVGKTGEYIPVIITNPVIMDGKSVTRASGHNYGYLIDNKLSIGSKIILSLAGDIIPFIYKITDTSRFNVDNMNLPENYIVNNCHMMAVLNKEEINHLKFVNSAMTLNIPNLGPAEIENIWKYINQDNGATDMFFDEETKSELPNNILLIKPEDVYFGITYATKKESTVKANKIKKAFEDILLNITLKDIIKSCNFTSCGDKVAEQCAKFMVTGPESADFTHLANKGYDWVFNMNSIQHIQITSILNNLGKSIEDFKSFMITSVENKSDQIPVILTGEPNNYKSKGEFLKCHPEYRNTTSWKEVKIVFTNSMDSKTGKMKKAIEKGIEIKLY